MSKYVVLPQEAHTSAPDALPDHSEHDVQLDDLDAFDYEAETPSLDHQDQTSENNGTSSMRMAFMNMANSILGAGIIGQPFAFRNSGLVGGIIVMVFLTFLIDWTLRLIVINAQKANTKSYQDTVHACYGRWGRVLLLVSISSFAYGGCMAFCVIIGDTIPHVLKLVLPASITDKDASFVGWFFERNVIICVFTTCISYPLSLNRDISKLAKASGFALFGMLIIVLVTVIRGPFVDSLLKGPLTTQQWTVNLNIFQGISVISFALVCHHNTIFIYNSMRNATLSKFAKLTHWACAISMFFCLLMGASGLLNFGSYTKGNILNNFKSNDAWANVARFCFGLNMLTTFPLEIFVVRDVLKDIVLVSEDGGSTAHMELTNKQHIIITTVLVFTSMSVSLFTCNLGMILELIGATSASLMAYIIPPLCYLKLTYDEVDYKKASKQERRNFIIQKAIPSILCTIFGFAVMFISSYKTIVNSINNSDGDSHCVID